MKTTYNDSTPVASWFDHFYWGYPLIYWPQWTTMKNNHDQGGKQVYLSSVNNQTQLNTAVHFVYKTVNEELCRLYQTSG